MRDHFSRSELVRRTTGAVRLATGFGKALDRLLVELSAAIYLTSGFKVETNALQEVRNGSAIVFDPFDMVGQGTAGNTGVMVAAVKGVVYGDMRDT